MLRQKAVCLACAGAGLFILLGAGVSGAGGPKGAGQDLAAVKAEMIRLTNAERAKANLKPLVEDARLSRAAQKHTNLMAEKGTLSHRVGGTSPGDRLDAENYKWRSVDEIIADGVRKADAADVVRRWMRSKGHREAILTAEYIHIGVGLSYDSAGYPYYTEVFAQPK